MDWKQVIERWQALPPEEQARLMRQRIPLNVAESMAFEGEPSPVRVSAARLSRQTRRL